MAENLKPKNKIFLKVFTVLIVTVLTAGLCFAEYDQDVQDIEKSISQLENIEHQTPDRPDNIYDPLNVSPDTTQNNNSQPENVKNSDVTENRFFNRNTEKKSVKKRNTDELYQSNQDLYNRNYTNQTQYERNSVTSDYPSYQQNSAPQTQYNDIRQNVQQTKNKNITKELDDENIDSEKKTDYKKSNDNDTFTGFVIFGSFALIIIITGIVITFMYFCKKILCLNIPYLPNIRMRKQAQKENKNVKKKHKKKKRSSILITKARKKENGEFIQPETETTEFATNTVSENTSYTVEENLKLKSRIINSESPEDIQTAVILFAKITS